MKRHVLWFLVVCVILLVGGLWMVGMPRQSSSSDDNTDRTVVRHDKDRPSSGGAEEERRVFRPTVTEVSGTVLSRQGEGQDWKKVMSGQTLNEKDAIRTEKRALLSLDLGGASTLDLMGASEVEVRELSGAVQRLGLLKGQAMIDYTSQDDQQLQLENREGSVVAEVNTGKFVMMNNGRVVAVATETGKVDLSAAGKSVTVSGGQQSVVVDQGGPSEPMDVAVAALLRVTDGVCRFRNTNSVFVSGAVSPGDSVSVHGMDVKVNSSGTFTTAVELPAGKKSVVVQVTDVWGKHKKRILNCAPIKNKSGVKDVEIEWGGRGL